MGWESFMPSFEKITREKIIRALLDASFEKSEGATSLADISEILGIKKASLYNHYENRDAIVDDTIRWCGEYLKKLNFIPSDMTTTAQKYPAEAVIKGLVNRWYKMHEKDPLIKIYSFIESGKYFSNTAKEIVKENRERMTSQVSQAFKSLMNAKKIRPLSEKELSLYAENFSQSLREILDFFIVERKEKMRLNPENWEGSLFSNIAETQENTEMFEKLVEHISNSLRNA